jgi:hypothetical protein
MDARLQEWEHKSQELSKRRLKQEEEIKSQEQTLEMQK